MSALRHTAASTPALSLRFAVPRRVLVFVGITLVAALALALRLGGIHRGLIYPDGYDYLLMARGIGAHLSPTTALGPGGLLFVPSPDAALKPLFPALVAVLTPFSGARHAAEVLTAAAGAATVVLAGLLAARLTGSRLAGLLAAAATLLSPALAHWSGFTGPDPLALALALATALCLAHDRASAAGVLGGLCAATRPEWALVMLGAGGAALTLATTRATARAALLSGAFTLAAVIALIRPPLAVPQGGPLRLLAALLAAFALQLIAIHASARPRAAMVAAATAVLAIVAVALIGSVPALLRLLADGWPLFALAAVGVVLAVRGSAARSALMLLATVIALGAIYAYRNPGSERYMAQLVPLAAVAAGFAIAPGVLLPSRSRGLALGLVVGVPALSLLIAPPRPTLAPDAFAALSARLGHEPSGALVSAAPDAYGFLLPGRQQLALRPGARGLVLLDGAQRAYAPGLTAHGTVVDRIPQPAGFERPDGTIDTAPALLVRGVVVRTG